jgi:LPS export ABC transporter protein LptC
MMTPTPSKTTLLRRTLWIGAVLVLGTAGAVWFGTRRLATVPGPAPSAPPAGVGMVLDRIHQTATREGRTEWSLDALSAQFLQSERRVLLKEPSVTFFLKDGGKVFLTAERGEVATDTNDMQAEGDVVIRNELYRLETAKVSYRHGPRVIESQTPVKIRGRSGELTADGLFFDLNTNQVTMGGNVRGTLVSDPAQ